MSEASKREIRSVREFMQRYFPGRLARLEREGRCIYCGQVKPKPRKERS